MMVRRGRMSVGDMAPLERMFRSDSSTLDLRYVKERKSLEGLGLFLNRGLCHSIILTEPASSEILRFVLSEMSSARNVIETFRVDLWLGDNQEYIELFRDAFKSHSQSLVELSLRCRLSAPFVAKILPEVPSGVRVLDLSENILSECSFLGPLVLLIERSELRVLRMSNCCMRPLVRNEFVRELSQLQSPIALEALEGLNLADCDEIPRAVRAVLHEPLAKTRKDQMGYVDIAGGSQAESGMQFLDYLKSSLLMKRLVGSKVRVWWPPTSDESRSAFSGRYWPALVLRVNPVDLIFVVEYDNQEVDHVPCRFVQPFSPFKYGGGLQENFIQFLLGTNYWSHFSDAFLKFRGYSISAFLDPLSSNHISKHLEPIPSISKHFKNIQKNIEMVENGARLPLPQVDVESLFVRFLGNVGLKSDVKFEKRLELGLEMNVETYLGLSGEFSGNLLVPGEVCEFRDFMDINGSDPSDYVGVIKSVSSEEPLYQCTCIYHDDEEVIELESDNVRRVVVIPWYTWCRLSLLVERVLLFSSTDPCRLQEIISSQFFYTAKNEDPDYPFHNKSPPNPLEMQLEPLEKFIERIGREITLHPRISLKNSQSAKLGTMETESAQINNLKLELRKQQQKIETLQNMCQNLRTQLEHEQNRNLELEAKIRCIICFDTRINCILNPCRHFNFCSRCAENFKCCPICRRKITRKQLINVE